MAKFVRTAFVFAGLLGTCGGGGGAFPSPIEPTMFPRKLMTAKTGGRKSTGTTVAADCDESIEKS